jgi:peptidoglycan/LPS O-acetylase OafA/YrhL
MNNDEGEQALLEQVHIGYSVHTNYASPDGIMHHGLKLAALTIDGYVLNDPSTGKKLNMSVGVRSSRIDALRGIAIVLVLLHHFNISYRMNDTLLAHVLGWNTINAVFQNGNYAVTAFFVISGYLITSNALRRWGSLSDIEALTFYRFRAARILPCLTLLLLIVNSLAYAKISIFQNNPEFGGFVPFWVVDLASLTFWMNVLMSHAGWLNYVLCVQWSLSIEEVFYLSFPVLCHVFKRENFLLLAWSAFIVIGPVWRATHLATEYEELNSYLSCFDGIAFGCCAAVLGKRILLPTWSITPIQIVVAAAMSYLYLADWIGNTAVYGMTLMALGTAVLLIAQAQAAPYKPLIALEPLRFCGRLSYELYLFHLIVLGFMRTIWPSTTTIGDAKLLLLGAYLILSAILAFLVATYYSEPLNHRLRGAPHTPIRLRNTWSNDKLLTRERS